MIFKRYFVLKNILNSNQYLQKLELLSAEDNKIIDCLQVMVE